MKWNFDIDFENYGIVKEYENCTLWFEPITDELNGFVLRTKTDAIIEVYMLQ